MNKAKQFIIGLACGMSPDHIMLRDIKIDAELALEMLETRSITKADLMSTGINGKNFFEFAQTWQNLPRLLKILRDNGERMDISDFMRPIKDGKTLVKMAEDINVVPCVFLPEIWVGHSTEMETLWFALDKSKRTSTDFLNLRRIVASAEGRELREDQLARAGITADEMRTAVRMGKFDKVKEKLADRGGRLHAEDLLLMDFLGDHAMDTTTCWENAHVTFTEMLGQGVRFEPWHFLFRRGDKKSILDFAMDPVSKGGSKHLFSAKIWAGRPEAAMELYRHVLPEKRKEIDMSALLNDIYNGMYGDLTDPRDVTVQDLVTPFDPDSAANVLPLGISAVWNDMPAIREHLKSRGEKLTAAHLLLPSGHLHESGLVLAARFGKIDQAIAIMADNNEKLSFADLTVKLENQHETLLQIICRTHQQAALLAPSNWVGRGEELLKVWNAMTDEERKGVDFKRIHSDVNRQTLRQRFAGGPSI